VSCDPERVTGYVDGVLDSAAAAEIEAHLATCRDCREQAEFERSLRARLRGLAPVEAPPRLESRVRLALQEPRRSPAWYWGLPIAAGIVLLLLWGRGSAAFVAWELARDHDHCFGKERLPAKVWSSDPVLVARWFEKEGTTVPSLPESAHGLELVGGRFCPLVDRSVAHVYYTGTAGRFSVFVVPGSVRVERARIASVRGHTVGLLSVGRKTIGLVGEDPESVDAFRRALATSIAWGLVPGVEGD
jgi:anti-sigma factor RsiW